MDSTTIVLNRRPREAIYALSRRKFFPERAFSIVNQRKMFSFPFYDHQGSRPVLKSVSVHLLKITVSFASTLA